MNESSYRAMRGLARFNLVRKVVAIIMGSENNDFEMVEGESSLKSELNSQDFIEKLKNDGICFGLELPGTAIESIVEYAKENFVYADRDENKGFLVENRKEAEKALGKEILVAQYFNVQSKLECINEIANDPLIKNIVRGYLGPKASFVGANLWWTFPVNASEEDKNRHAHLYHRDIDDFKFLKFFFYITNVEENDGGHFFVKGSMKKSPPKKWSENFKAKRYSDEEISDYYGFDNIL
ncbi:hypothetical protein, partial [Idiomarina abyssalis]|uniref:hypothetical protein n=1 Tax=Idiomarina abyssalis TaxID=86102 RepID=UPI003A8D9F4E